MTGPSGPMGMVVRAFYCRPLRSAFDIALRDVLIPGLLACRGVVDVCAGRKGPDELSDRLVVSLWTSLAAMDVAMGEDVEASRFDPELLDQTADRLVEVLPVLLAVADDTDTPLGVLRVARGELREMDVERYAERVRAGVEEDRARGHGPRWLVLARTSARGFLTISRWTDWTSIQAATGATIQDPIRTKRQAEIAAFEADHYELLPSASRPPAG